MKWRPSRSLVLTYRHGIVGVPSVHFLIRIPRSSDEQELSKKKDLRNGSPILLLRLYYHHDTKPRIETLNQEGICLPLLRLYLTIFPVRTRKAIFLVINLLMNYYSPTNILLCSTSLFFGSVVIEKKENLGWTLPFTWVSISVEYSDEKYHQEVLKETLSIFLNNWELLE